MCIRDSARVDHLNARVNHNTKLIVITEVALDENTFDISVLKRKTNFCGSRETWTTQNSIINYDSILISDNNVQESSFSIDTGLFTAGRAGTFSVQALGDKSNLKSD